MSGRVLASTALAAAIATAAGAQAGGEPSALGNARLGTLTVTSGILVERRSAELRGVWNDTRLPCRTTRGLRVQVSVDYVPRSGRPRRAARTGVFRDPNCAEGGPNVGFTVVARKLAMACPDGSWRPARYTFVTRTTEPATRLQATASLSWERPGRC